MIQLYSLNIKENSDFIKSEAAAAIVSAKRLEWSRKFRNESDFMLSMGGELLSRAIIRQRLKIKNEDIIFSKTEYGKPFLAGLENFHFNVSHSGELVICAAADIEIGCDCEFISAENKIDDLKIVYTHNEYKSIHSLSGPDKTIFCHNLWALKESYLKCSGIGLNEEPAALEILFENQSPAVYKKGRRLDCLLKLYNDYRQYAIALCVNNSLSNIEKLLPDCVTQYSLCKTAPKYLGRD
jgi:4'-phosphopantetheinyl transferase